MVVKLLCTTKHIIVISDLIFYSYKINSHDVTFSQLEKERYFYEVNIL